MNVAVLHYHFNRGGVTQVVLNQLRALDQVADEPLRVALIFGGRQEGFPAALATQFEQLQLDLHCVPELEYDDGSDPQPGRLADAVRTALGQCGFDSSNTLLHVHNHALGKNASIAGSLARMACDGYRLLLQIHDFAEDLRPDNYRRLVQSQDGGTQNVVYPQARHVHYAVLNSRDYHILREAGIDASALHLLPNSVAEVGDLPPRRQARKQLAERHGISDSARYLVYPVRGIRRKNLGEALLWSVLGGEDTFVSFTLPPQNPVELASYQQWRRFAEANDMRCIFETGGPQGLKFLTNLAAADSILTTSVAEGFGLVFLETWLAGRPLVGRDLPEITEDFVRAGLRFDGLRPQLTVPTQWVGRQYLQETLESTFARLLEDYGLQGHPLANSQEFARIVADEKIDFAFLNGDMQRRVLQRVLSEATYRYEILSMNPWIDGLFGAQQGQVIEANATTVRRVYNQQHTGRELLSIYRQLSGCAVDDDVVELAQRDTILTAFLDPARMYPIRFES
jgi:hypothetical protein